MFLLNAKRLLYTKKILFVFLILVFCFGSSGWAARRRGGRIGQEITFFSKDGIKISGLYKQAASRSNKTFILLHGLGSNQEEWQSFASRLVKSGYGFLSYDARGHGQSTKTSKGKTISYERFGMPGPKSEWNKMVSDLEQAINYLVNTKKIPSKKIGLIGASLGANVCLIYGASNKSIPQIVLLSPGLNYAGLDASQYISAYKNRPILIVSAPNDTYSYQSSYLLYNQIKSSKKASLYSGKNGKHGVQMLDRWLTNKILAWMSRY